MKMITLLRNAPIMILFLMCQLWAQLEVNLRPQRQDYMLGEDVHVELTLFNNSNSTLTLNRLPGRPWLSLSVSLMGESSALSPKAIANFPRVVLAPGQKMAYKINLNTIYDFRTEGNYRIAAIVRMPDMKTAFSSSNARFRIGSGSVHKKFITHVRGKRMEMRAKFWRLNNKNVIFGQVADADSGRVIGAAYMGQFLNFMEPKYLLDAQQNLHMLFQSTPEFYTYSILSTTGKCRLSKLYKRAPGLPVTLVSQGEGIKVLGVVPYTPSKDGADQFRKATDRPNF